MTEDKAVRAAYQPRTVQSVSHAITIMRILATSGGAPTLSAIARKLGLSKPATYNLLNTLIAEGIVVKDASARYRVGWGMYELGSVVDRAQEIKRAARFPLDRLAEQTGGAALLAVLEQDSVLYLDRGQVVPDFAMVANAGRRFPLHTNASGKVLMAHAKESTVSRYLQRPLRPLTNRSITTTHELLNELRRVREDGHGVCWGEQEPALSSLAAPIVDRHGTVVASLAIALPSETFARRSRQRLANQLREQADEVTAALQI